VLFDDLFVVVEVLIILLIDYELSKRIGVEGK